MAGSAAAGRMAATGIASTAAVGALGSHPLSSIALQGCTDTVPSPEDASHPNQEHDKHSSP